MWFSIKSYCLVCNHCYFNHFCLWLLMLVFLNYFDKKSLISYTSHDGHFVLDSLSPAPCQGQTSSPSVLEKIKSLLYLEYDCIFYLWHLLSFPHLYLSIPTSSHQLAAAGAVPSMMAMASIAPSQCRRGMKDKSNPPYSPSAPLAVPD